VCRRAGYFGVILVMSIFVGLTIIREFYKGAQARAYGTGERFHEAIVNLTMRNTRRYGGYIIHFGFVLLFIGWSGQAFSEKVRLPESRIGELKSATAIAVVLWADPRKFYSARVREIAPAVDPVTRTFAVRVSILDPDPGVQWGMTANVAVGNRGASSSAVLPLTSIYRKDGQPAVWIYDQAARTVTLRSVEVGQYREDGVIVSSGLRDGEWVVTAGVHKLREGESVRPFEGGGDGKPATSPARAPASAPAAAPVKSANAV